MSGVALRVRMLRECTLLRGRARSSDWRLIEERAWHCGFCFALERESVLYSCELFLKVKGGLPCSLFGVSSECF